jgi:hypothetical protein
VAAEVRDFSPADFIAPRHAKTMGRFAQFAVVATRLAIDDADLAITSQNSEQTGVAYGTSLAGVDDLASQIFRRFGECAVRGIPAASVVEYPPPLISRRTTTPPRYLIAEYAMLTQWLLGASLEFLHGRLLHGWFALANAAFLAYALIRFIGLPELRDQLALALRFRQSRRVAESGFIACAVTLVGSRPVTAIRRSGSRGEWWEPAGSRHAGLARPAGERSSRPARRYQHSGYHFER